MPHAIFYQHGFLHVVGVVYEDKAAFPAAHGNRKGGITYTGDTIISASPSG
ncbi:MAG TPA: hypothetical protein G4O02_09155 [Caldilineae bacterium]|nr:hypothetical protein [Caldilineae bacterium]